MTVQTTFYRGVHQGGSKEYQILVIEGKKHSIVLKMWGKVDRTNLSKSEVYQTGGELDRAMSRALDERLKKGYSMGFEGVVENPRGLLDMVKFDARSQLNIALLSKIEEGTLRAIWPDCEIPDQLKNTFRCFDAPATGDEFETDEHEDPASPDEDLETLKKNPLFGMFG